MFGRTRFRGSPCRDAAPIRGFRNDMYDLSDERVPAPLKELRDILIEVLK
jgi:hypothetical protein